MARSGKFHLENPDKYIGNPNNIFYRSQWETVLMRFLDRHPDVIKWGSEELIIPYYHPFKKRMARYFPDFYIKQRSKTGEIEEIIVEVKPYYQTIPPVIKTLKNGQLSKISKKQVIDWEINKAKWKAAEKFCKKKNWIFIKMTEYDLGIKKRG